jgi:hypothetical protein
MLPFCHRFCERLIAHGRRYYIMKPITIVRRRGRDGSGCPFLRSKP